MATQKLSSLKQQLSRPAHLRTVNDVIALQQATRHIQFFQDQIQENGPEVHAYCCQYMELEEFQVGQIVCRQGDRGFKFYIIFEGVVQVFHDSADDGTILSELGPGSAFGEMALIHNRPRLATVSCVADCVFGVLHKSQYTQVLGKVMSIKLRDSVVFLKSIPLFSGWTKYHLERFYLFFRRRVYAKDAVVFRQGELSDNVFIVHTGEFKLTKKVSHSGSTQYFVRNNKRLNAVPKPMVCTHSTVAVLGTREIIGDEEAKSGAPMAFTCICTSSSGQLLVISRADFLTNIKDEDSLRILDSCKVLKQRIRSRVSPTKHIVTDPSQNVTHKSVKKHRPFMLHEKTQSTSFSVLKIKTGLTPRRRASFAQPQKRIKHLDKLKARLIPYFMQGQQSVSKLKRLGLLEAW